MKNNKESKQQNGEILIKLFKILFMYENMVVINDNYNNSLKNILFNINF